MIIPFHTNSPIRKPLHTRIPNPAIARFAGGPTEVLMAYFSSDTPRQGLLYYPFAQFRPQRPVELRACLPGC